MSIDLPLAAGIGDCAAEWAAHSREHTNVAKKVFMEDGASADECRKGIPKIYDS